MNEKALRSRLRDMSYSIPWNIFLLALGSFLIAVAVNAVIVPNAFLPSGMSGLALLFYYIFKGMSPGAWYMVLNIPVFIAGWFLISRKFFVYSLLGTALLSGFMEIVPWTIQLHDKWLAVMAGGIILGAGSGISLRSLGSTGGAAILQIFFRERFGIRVGQFSTAFNATVLSAGIFWLNFEDVLYSLALIFVSSWVMDAFQSLFNQRKMALVITSHPIDVAGAIMTRLGRGTTLLNARGGYTGEERTVIMTVIDSYRVKRLEATVFAIDPNAFVIIEPTFNVIGKGFSLPKSFK